MEICFTGVSFFCCNLISRYDSGVYCPYRRDKDATSYASREETVEAAEAKWRESSGKTSEM